MKTQVCVRCTQAKTQDAFPAVGPTERLGMCVPCRAKDRDRVKSQTQRKANAARLDAYKADKACSGCGIADPVVLTFHHPEANTTTVSKLLWKDKSWKRIMQEVDACVILCLNCHAIEHQKCKVTGEKIRGWSPNDPK